jgi:hypothetical protein
MFSIGAGEAAGLTEAILFRKFSDACGRGVRTSQHATNNMQSTQVYIFVWTHAQIIAAAGSQCPA